MTGLHVRETDLGWAVFNADSNRVSPVFHKAELATDALTRRLDAKRNWASCARCKEKYRKRTVGQRICQSCKALKAH